jgi:hypothetical protein
MLVKVPQGAKVDLKLYVQLMLMSALDATPIDYDKLKKESSYLQQRIGSILGFARARASGELLSKYKYDGTKDEINKAVAEYKKRAIRILDEIDDCFSSFDIFRWKKETDLATFKMWNILHLFFLRGLYWTPSFPAVRHVTIEQGDLPELWRGSNAVLPFPVEQAGAKPESTTSHVEV